MRGRRGPAAAIRVHGSLLTANAIRDRTRDGAAGGLRLAVQRAAGLWRSKLALTVLLALLVQGPYFLIQRFPPWPAGSFEPWLLDRWVAFDPDWTWVYLSVYLLVPIPPWLATHATDLHRYARGMAWIGLIASAFFLLHPIMGPRPEPLPETNALFDFLVRIDQPTNAFPALHVAVPAYSLLFAWHLLVGSPGTLGRTALGFGWLWLALIAYATLATKQHYAADILAGFALGWLADRWAGRTRRRKVGLRADRSPH